MKVGTRVATKPDKLDPLLLGSSAMISQVISSRSRGKSQLQLGLRIVTIEDSSCSCEQR